VDLKKKLLDMAVEATGDTEVTVAGDFEPKGLAWKRAAGATAGAFIGSEIGDGWTGIGAVAGAHAGQRAGTSGDLPPVVVLAASPTTLYVLTTNNAKGIISAKSLIKMGEHAREDLTFEMKQKVTVRTVVIHDEATGAQLKMEGRRILFHHMNDILDVLAGDEDLSTPASTEAT
jgi:co-chaperonin GroES (HSP10)